MLIRIVRMSFQPAWVPAFQALFAETAGLIRQQPGCRRLELWQDADEPTIFCTHSHWDDQAALDDYRRSALFGRVWPATKRLFAAPPLAFSSQLAAEGSPYGNITARELDRDLVNLHLPEADLVSSREEAEASSAPGFLDSLLRGLEEDDKRAGRNATAQP